MSIAALVPLAAGTAATGGLAKPLLIAGIAGSAGAGLMSFMSAQQQSKALEAQGKLQRQERNEEAVRAQAENERLSTAQKLAYLKNGISIKGTSQLVLEDTKREGDKLAHSIRRRGAAEEKLAKVNASTTRAKGRADLIGGFTGAAKTGLYGAQEGILG